MLPKSTNPQRISNNRNVIELSSAELALLDGLAETTGKAQRLNTPLWGWDLGFDDWYGPVKR